MDGILASLFAGMALEIVKGLAAKVFGKSGDELVTRIHDAMDRAAEEFFREYDESFGIPRNSFLAREDNWVIAISSLRYDTPKLSADQLNPEGFENARPADKEALERFIDFVQQEFQSDFFLNIMLGIKETVTLGREMMQALQQLVAQHASAAEPETLATYEVQGGDLPPQTELEEGKLYVRDVTDNVRMTYMRRGNRIYSEALFDDGAVMYYEIDENAEVHMKQPPYPVSIHIPPEYIVESKILHDEKGNQKLRIDGKWGLRVECEINATGQYLNPKIQYGEVTINSRDKQMVITPKHTGEPKHGV